MPIPYLHHWQCGRAGNTMSIPYLRHLQFGRAELNGGGVRHGAIFFADDGVCHSVAVDDIPGVRHGHFGCCPTKVGSWHGVPVVPVLFVSDADCVGPTPAVAPLGTSDAYCWVLSHIPQKDVMVAMILIEDVLMLLLMIKYCWNKQANIT